jgi:hypothetical protein
MRYLCSYFEGFFNMSWNLTTWGLRHYFRSKRRRSVNFCRAWQSIALGWVWTCKPWLQWFFKRWYNT